MAMDKQKLQQIKESMKEHRLKMETDPAYKARCEEIEKRMDKHLPGFGNDTEE